MESKSPKIGWRFQTLFANVESHTGKTMFVSEFAWDILGLQWLEYIEYTYVLHVFYYFPYFSHVSFSSVIVTHLFEESNNYTET